MKTAKYYIYRNLHTNSFSVQYKGIVIARPENAILTDAIFTVSNKGRQRVIRERRKNVHAKVGATLFKELEGLLDTSSLVEIYYNPYIYPQFTNSVTGLPIKFAPVVYATQNKIYIDS